MAQRHRSGVGFIILRPHIRTCQTVDRARDLLFTRAPRTHHGLLHTQGAYSNTGRPDITAAAMAAPRGRSENLCRLEILHIDRLLNRDMLDLVLVDKILHLIANCAQALRHGK